MKGGFQASTSTSGPSAPPPIPPSDLTIEHLASELSSVKQDVSMLRMEVDSLKALCKERGSTASQSSSSLPLPQPSPLASPSMLEPSSLVPSSSVPSSPLLALSPLPDSLSPLPDSPTYETSRPSEIPKETPRPNLGKLFCVCVCWEV